MSKNQEKPESVDPGAWWDEGDNEWVIGQKDADGILQGIVKYWRPDGTLISKETLSNGKSDGPYTRYHETGEVSRVGIMKGRVRIGRDVAYRANGTTTELAFPAQANSRIQSIETYWQDGNFTHQVMRDKDGNLLTRAGKPAPDRPSSVPEAAVYIDGDSEWASGTYTVSLEKVGVWRYFNDDGDLLREEAHGEDVGTEPAFVPWFTI